MKQFAIYTNDIVLVGHIIASNPQAAIEKAKERDKWLADQKVIAKLV